MRYGPAVIALAWLGFLSAAPSAAQDAPRFRKGLMMGVTAASLSGGDLSDLIDRSSRVSVGGGAFVAHSLNHVVSIQVEARYTGKGAKTISAATDVDGNKIGEVTSTWELDYVNVPMLLRFAVSTSSRMRPFVSAGPDFGFNVMSKVRTELETSGGAPVTVLSEDLDAKGLDVGLTVGIGLEFGAGSDRVFLDTRYTFGLGEAFETASALEDKNRAWTFSVGYAF